MATFINVAPKKVLGFLDLPRELRDLTYLDMLSHNGKTINFPWTDEDGQQALDGPKVLNILLTCSQAYHEMKDMMHNDLTLRLDNDDVPVRRLLAKLHARDAKKLSIARFTSRTPLRYSYGRSYGIRPGTDVASSVNLLNMRFPNLRKLELGVDVLEFLSHWFSFDFVVARYLEDDQDPRSFTPLLQTLQKLRTHPNIGNMHICLVWKTFLEDHRDSRYADNAVYRGQLPQHCVGENYSQELRERLRERTIELAKVYLPLATVTGRASEDE